MKNPLFSLDRATINHRGQTVLRDITISLMPDEFLGVIGPNGAGKSTLLMTLIGFRHICSGRGEIFGKDICKLDMSGWTGIRKKIGYLPQKLFIDPFFPITVEEVVLMGRIGHSGLLSNYTKDDLMRAEKCMEDMGLIDLRKRPIGQLSGGGTAEGPHNPDIDSVP